MFVFVRAVRGVARLALMVLAFAAPSASAQPASPGSAGDALASDQSTMFRGSPAHTGMSNARFFAGQGGVKWSARTGGMVRSTPAVTATRVFAGSGDGSLHALDRATGRSVWTFAAGSPVHSSPAVSRGLVVAASRAGRVFAVDETTGRLRWSKQTRAPLPSNIPERSIYDYEYFVPSPTIVGQMVLIGAPDGGIYAFDLATGAERWRFQTKGRVNATPSVHEGMVIVGSFDGRVYALDVATGKERWVFRTLGDTIDLEKAGYDRRAVQSSAAIANGVAYFGSRDDGVYAIDAKMGTQRWRVSHGTSWVVGTPAVDDHGRVFAGSSDGRFVQGLDAATGRELWRVPTNGNVQTSPLRVGDALIVGTYRTQDVTGELLVLDASSGAVNWRLRLDGAMLSSPVAVDDELYVGTDGGSILAIHESSRVVPRLAVYYDSAPTPRPYAGGSRLAFEYFRGLGYQTIGPDSLAPFLAAWARDGAPSAIVFVSDVLPREIASGGSESALVRRYLESGGKVVWLSIPIGALVRDSTGRPIAFDFKRAEAITGVSFASVNGDELGSYPTPAGKRAGLERWFPGRFLLDTAAVSETWAVDEFGQATAWRQIYRPDRPGSGYVQLWGFGATIERLPSIRAATEHGLLRAGSR